MVDNVYKNAFKEVYTILQNTEMELVKLIPKKFIIFLKDNMNSEYKCNINTNLGIDKQYLLPETEDILSLIYRSYFATDKEKIEFSAKDKQDLLEFEEKKKTQYKNIEEIFEKRKSLNNVTLDTNLAIIKKESFFKKILKKLLNIFNK